MKKDEIIVNGKWEFDKDVTDCFDDMLSRSIPDYNTMRKLTLDITEPYIQDNFFSMLDLGCSNGINLDMFINKYANKGVYVGVDTSAEMIKGATEKLNKYDVQVKLINDDVINIEKYSLFNYDIVTSILTIQFVPMEKRPELLSTIYKSMKSGGVFILVEKILQPVFEFDKLFVDSYYKIKRENGYTYEQIFAKKKSLEGVLVPNTHNGNFELLKSVGFKYIDTFWKCLNFEGYIAVK